MFGHKVMQDFTPYKPLTFHVSAGPDRGLRHRRFAADGNYAEEFWVSIDGNSRGQLYGVLSKDNVTFAVDTKSVRSREEEGKAISIDWL
ncbi:hypothetical protein EJB05_01229, partial [Eragrostis curvula]